jgi:hypothetical protein
MKRKRKKVLYLVMAYDADKSGLDGWEHSHSRREALKLATEKAREDGVATVTVYRAVLEGEPQPATVTFTEPYSD